MLGNNEEWVTNVWVYVVIAIIGALSGLQIIREAMVSSSIGETCMQIFKIGIIVSLMAWGGCTIAAFIGIPASKSALRRSIFNLVAAILVFYVCAILSIVAIIVIVAMIALFALASGGGRGSSKKSSSADDGTIYDGSGNIHYVSSQDGDYVNTTDGGRYRRRPDGNYDSY